MQPLAVRPRRRFYRPRRRLRAGLVQMLCVLAGLGLGLLLPRITFDATVASTRVTDLLVGVGFGVLGLVTIVFSLLFLVVRWAFSSLSPRLNLFRDDPIVWRTFGFAIGVFVFSVTAALVIGDQQNVSVIVPAAEVVAVVAALALIRTLQLKAFASIQLAPTLSAIAGQGHGVIDALYPPAVHGRAAADHAAAAAVPGGLVAGPPGDLAATRAARDAVRLALPGRSRPMRRARAGVLRELNAGRLPAATAVMTLGLLTRPGVPELHRAAGAVTVPAGWWPLRLAYGREKRSGSNGQTYRCCSGRAEDEGFEPSRACTQHAFQACAIGH